MPDGIDGFLSLRVTLKNVLFIGAFTVGWPAIFRLYGLYNAEQVRRHAREFVRLVVACSTGTSLVLPFALTSVSGAFHWNSILQFWLGAVLAASCVRLTRRGVLRQRRSHTARRVVIVGSGPRAYDLSRSLLSDKDTSCEIVGFIEAAGQWIDGSDGKGQRLGTLDQLEAILMLQQVDELFVTLPVKSHYQAIKEVIGICERVGVRVNYYADIFGSSLARPRYSSSHGSPVVTMHGAPDDERLVLKRVIDVCGATVALVLLMPIMVLAAAAIKLTSSGPVIFPQERCGLNKRRFRMYKFRTMVVDAERRQRDLECLNEAAGPVFKIKRDPRLTPIGRFLRKTSIDELPQLINVIRGEMSLVGPRPLPLRDVQRFTTPADMRRFSVKPGLTCLWQISGRSNLGFNEWIRLDLQYIDQWSLALDFRILLSTVPAVLRGTGAT